MTQIVMLFALLSSHASAQSTGSLRGQILDEDDLEVPDATITLTSPCIPGGTMEQQTNNLGVYLFNKLLPCAYTVTAARTGFKVTSIAGVPVLVNRTTTQDLVLKMGVEEQVIDVIGRQTVSTESVQASQVLTKEFLRNIPTGRSYRQAVQTVAGVGGGSNPNIGGGGTVFRPPHETVDDDQWRGSHQDNSSTFAIDVDTAAWTRTRWYLNHGKLPPADLVRVEEMINYFDYDLPAPPDGEAFAVDLEAGPSPFEAGTHLLRVGIQATLPAERPPAHLVYLVDVSGSMSSAGKLTLVQHTLLSVLDQLHGDDTIAIVTYAGRESIALPPTSVQDRSVIREAITRLRSGGSTNGEGGLRTAYRLADEYFQHGAINRVILATDGDFNVGITGKPLVQLISSYRNRGIFLSTLGFGSGADAFMEQLADKGNGQYLFMDSRRAVSKVVGEQLGGMLQVVAKDAKVQLHFHEDAVQSWRFIGYRNRLMADEDFANDAVDGGELGAGHNVVAYYALVLQPDAHGPLVDVDMRHKTPEGERSVKRSWTMDAGDIRADVAQTSEGFRFGAAVATFGERLAEPSCGQSHHDILEVIEPLEWKDGEELAEMIGMVRRASDGCDRLPTDR